MTEAAETRIEVAVGLIRENPGADRVLITLRPAGTPYAGWWEFPGGKLEPGEDAAAGVARELREELAIDVAVEGGEPAIEHVYEHAAVRLWPMWCRWTGGRPRAIEVADWRWATPAEMDALPMLPANGPLLAAVRRRLGGLDEG